MSNRTDRRSPQQAAKHLWALACMLILFGWSSRASAQTYGNCTVSSPTIDLGSVSSFTVGTSSQTSSGSGGIACSSLLTLAATSYIKLAVDNSTFLLTGGPGNQTIPFAVSTSPGGTGLQAGSSVDMSTSSLLNLFAGVNGSIPLYVRTTPTTALRAGIYTGTVALHWYFGICTGLGIGGICLGYTSSPGLTTNIFGALTNWGSGVPATVTVKLTILNDCVINAPNVNFGTAPFVTGFNPVTQTISINCSAGQSYSVGLSDGSNFGTGSRRMFSSATSQYLNYEIYQGPSSTTRWGSVGTQRRSSDSADVNPEIYDSATKQGFTYRAVLDPTQTTPSAGSYTDTITLDVSFIG